MLGYHPKDDARTANLALTGLMCLFAFVVVFIFIAMNTQMATRSDLPPTAAEQSAHPAQPGAPTPAR